MSVLPSQKLTIGELFVSMAVGLIFYLLPGDLRNQVSTMGISEIAVLVTVLVICVVFFFIIKRYEAMGAALLTNSIIITFAFGFSILNGVLSKGSEFWPGFTVYQLATMFIVWIVPFLFTVIVRLSITDHRDTDDSRAGFARFLSLSLRALMLIYLLVIVFVEIIPKAPDMVNNRSILYIPFSRIQECIENASEWGIRYMLWNGLIMMPLSFSLLVVNNRIRWWHALFISAAAGLTIEIFQFALNTETVYVDDLFLYIAGGLIGVIIKSLIDRIRYKITKGKERHMLCLDFTPVSGQREVVEVYEEEQLSDEELILDDFDEEIDKTLEDNKPVSFTGTDEI